MALAASTSSKTTSTSTVIDAWSLVQDHVRLGLLEARYELALSGRRWALLIASLPLLLSTFVLLQVALVRGFMAAGAPLGWACVAAAALDAAVGGGMVWMSGRRPPGSGEPFQTTREEINKTLQWIRKRS